MRVWFQAIVKRRRRRRARAIRPELRDSITRAAGYLVLILVLHTVAMMRLEAMSAGDALWLTVTTVTTVGYGDLSATTVSGRVATTLLIYVGGIFVAAKVAGDYFDFRAERRERRIRGQWDWHMRDHILIVNTPAHDGVQYFVRLIQQFRGSTRFRETPVQLLTGTFPNGLPAALTALGSVVHFHGSADSFENLESAGAGEAQVIVILAKHEYEGQSDSVTFDVLHRLTELGTEATVLAECVHDANRQRLSGAGADIVIRPMRAYPGMVVRGFVAPGAERIMEDMFVSNGGEYRRFPVSIAERAWREIVCALINADVGTAVAYVAAGDGQIRINPPAEQVVAASAVIAMVREGAPEDTDAAARALIENS